MGQRDVRRLLVTGAMSVISASEQNGRCDDPWLANMLKKKPHPLMLGPLAEIMATLRGRGRPLQEALTVHQDL